MSKRFKHRRISKFKNFFENFCHFWISGEGVELSGVSDQPARNISTVDTLMDLVRNLFPENIIQAAVEKVQTVSIYPGNWETFAQLWLLMKTESISWFHLLNQDREDTANQRNDVGKLIFVNSANIFLDMSTVFWYCRIVSV